MYNFVIESLTHEFLMKIKARSLSELQKKVGHQFFIIIAKV